MNECITGILQEKMKKHMKWFEQVLRNLETTAAKKKFSAKTCNFKEQGEGGDKRLGSKYL